MKSGRKKWRVLFRRILELLSVLLAY